MIDSFPGDGWFTYVALDGRVLLKHRYRESLTILCPHCGKALEIREYRAQCCDQTFKISFGAITQHTPVGRSEERPRGWKSLRPYRHDQSTF